MFTFPEEGLLDGSSSTDIFYVAYADLTLGEQLTFTLTPVFAGNTTSRRHESGRFAHKLGQPADFRRRSAASWLGPRCYYAASAAVFSVEGLQPIS